MKFLGLVVLAWFLGRTLAFAQATADSVLVFGRLPCANGNRPRSHGIRQLVWELHKRTSMEAEVEAKEVDIRSPDLFQFPFVLWCCEGSVVPIGERELQRLRKFLRLGGFLWIDDPQADLQSPFSQSVFHLFARMFPERKFERIKSDHVLFKAFYLLTQSYGRVIKGPLMGLTIDERMAVVYSPNDILGAMSKDLYGNWELLCEPGGETQRENAFRLGINICLYSMCLDYKNDRVHLDFILRRRKL